MIWGAFAGGQKSQLIFMPKDRRSAKDFVEVVYNVELLHFMSRMPQGLLMEDGTPVHHSKVCEDGDKYTFWRSSIGLQILLISIQLRTFGRF